MWRVPLCCCVLATVGLTVCLMPQPIECKRSTAAHQEDLVLGRSQGPESLDVPLGVGPLSFPWPPPPSKGSSSKRKQQATQGKGARASKRKGGGLPMLMRNYQQLPGWLQKELSKWLAKSAAASPGSPGQCSTECIWLAVPDVWSKKAVQWWGKQNLADNVATGWLTSFLASLLPTRLIEAN